MLAKVQSPSYPLTFRQMVWFFCFVLCWLCWSENLTLCVLRRTSLIFLFPCLFPQTQIILGPRCYFHLPGCLSLPQRHCWIGDNCTCLAICGYFTRNMTHFMVMAAASFQILHFLFLWHHYSAQSSFKGTFQSKVI